MEFEVSKNAWSYLNNILEKFSDIFEKNIKGYVKVVPETNCVGLIASDRLRRNLNYVGISYFGK